MISLSKSIYCFLLIIILQVQNPVHASTGCYLPNYQLYPNKVSPGLINILLGATPIYQSSPYISLDPQCASPSQGSCRVCNGSFNTALGLITGCPSGFVYGVEVDYVVTCDLDTNNLMLVILSGGTGLLFIYKRNKD